MAASTKQTQLDFRQVRRHSLVDIKKERKETDQSSNQSQQTDASGKKTQLIKCHYHLLFSLLYGLFMLLLLLVVGKIEAKVDPELHLLRQFDLNLTYGPCIGNSYHNQCCYNLSCLGISRIERWERAKSFGLYPPTDVYDIIRHHLQDRVYTHW